jgi:hypothetical protein
MNLAPAILPAHDLEPLLLAAYPGVLLVKPRILWRVIKKHSGLTGPGLQVPHHKSYVLGRDELFAIAGREELDLPHDRELSETVILLPQLPENPENRTKYRRYLGHALIHLALRERRRAGALSVAAVRDRIRRIGMTEFAEAAAVLRQENFLLPGDETNLYEEFSALFLELRYCTPAMLPRYFPGIDAATAERVLAEDVDAAAIFAEVGRVLSEPEASAKDSSRPTSEPEALAKHRATSSLTLQAQTDDADHKGNLVRAAILRLRAGDTLAAEQTIARLVGHLLKALHRVEDDPATWQRCLTALLRPASTGMWPVEGRLLYDLQKICLDHERDIYAVDVVEFLESWGQRPVQRLLPYQADVLAVKHLRLAVRRLAAARLYSATRRDLDERLHDALHHAEVRVRERLRPVIVQTLDRVGLSPASVAETVSRDKLVEELLDRIVERGFLNIGDLRDALARNRLKMPDLSGPVEFFTGDPLVRVNRRFAESLDGIYRRGEIYLRWLQRLNSVAFGTRPGRFVTKYFLLPFGVAFVALEGFQHLLDLVLEHTGLKLPHYHAVGGAVGVTTFAFRGVHIPLTHWWSIGLLGVFLLGILHLPAFRRTVFRGLHLAACGLRLLLYDTPAFILHIQVVQAFFQSRPYLLFYQFVVKPLAYSSVVATGFYLLHSGALIAIGAGASTFLLTTLVFNSPLGQQVEELATDGVVRGWHLLSVDVFPGLFRWVMEFFRRILGGVERVIYTVDEWLRFRQGQGRLSYFAKLVLGLMWYVITYVVRFAVNLLIEPQINPIKHFPVVTVSHKVVMTTFVPYMASMLGGTAKAGTAAFLIGTGIPGIFGFLVWELKENWKMYRANQSPTLDPEMVGSHGETILRLLRPGFHSGTLPKLYAKLRHARGRSLRKREEDLHHVAESVRRFVERTLLATLAASLRWQTGSIGSRVAAIHCAVNRIRIELSSTMPGESVLLELEQHAGWLVCGVARSGWLSSLTAEQTEAWSAALAGFWKLAGVDIVRERVAALLPPGAAFAVTTAGLLVWLGDTEAHYTLNDDETLHPIGNAKLPDLKRTEVLFSETPLFWIDWVTTWERDDKEA